MTFVHPIRRQLAAAAVLLAAALSLLVPPTQAHADTPQLRVAVDNGRADATAGSSSVYTVTVTNLGGAKVKNLRLSQSVPAGARLVSAGAHGRLAQGQVTWTVDLPAAGSRTVRTTLRVDKLTPDTLLRLATVACVRRTADGAPLVCAADSDALPAEAAAAANGSATTTSSKLPGGVSAPWWAYGGAGAVVLVAAGAAVLAVRRRQRRATTGVGTPQ